MVKLSSADTAHLREALLSCREEFEELVRTKEWFVTDCLDLIESALEILEHEEE